MISQDIFRQALAIFSEPNIVAQTVLRREDVVPLVKALRAYNHMHSPATKLPAEILLRIIWYLFPSQVYEVNRILTNICAVVDGEDEEEKRKRSYTELLALTHVCHYWRDVTLNAPRLWALVRFSGSKSSQLLAREFLRRLGTRLPSTVVVRTTLTRKPERDPLLTLATFFPNQLHNVKNLHLYLAYPGPDITILTKPADHLELLSIIGLEDEFFTLPMLVFAGCSESLRRVFLKNLSVPIVCSALWNITHLTLEGVLLERPNPEEYHTNRTYTKLDVTHLLKSLKHSPGLEELKLDGVGPAVRKGRVKLLRREPNSPIHFPSFEKSSSSMF